MTKIDIVSGFLGAGKTTLIKKLLKEALAGEQVVLIENEFGKIGIDGGFLKEAGIEIKEMNSGCICCSLVGDFGTSLKEVLSKYTPDRILIEPSGVGKLSDVMKAVEDATESADVQLGSAVAVVDAKKCKVYLKNFGEFFANQIAHAGTVILSRTGEMKEEKINQCMELIRGLNEKAAIITTPWEELEGVKILEAMEHAKDLESELMAEVIAEHDEHCSCGCHDHHHEHHDHDHECHHHDHDHHHDHECCHHDHEHHHEHHHDHEHHHEHDEHCTCGCHDHDHHGHHHADEVFTSWGFETPDKYSKEQITAILEKLEDKDTYGFVLRAKGMVADLDGGFIHFDYVPGESEVRSGGAEYTGKVCVIGSGLLEDNLKKLFEEK